jgi:hypothetical protein
MKSLFKRLMAYAAILTYSSTFFAQLPSYLPTNGLVAWYPFNGNANDESGNGNNGILGNVIPAADRYGNADGAYDMNSSFISLSQSIRIQNGQNHTIGAWVKINNLEETRLFSHRNATGYEGAELPILNNNLVPYYGEAGNNFQWLNLTPLGIPFQQYALVICVIDKATGLLSLYINGNFTGSFIISNINNVENNSIAFIGNRPNYNAPSSFTIDEFFFYDRAISPTEIHAINQFSSSGSLVNSIPPGIPYQAALRNVSGDLLANSSVNVRFTIHEMSPYGETSYQETHPLETNELGLFTTTIGAGNAIQGTFAGILWSQTTKFLEVEVDLGEGYTTIGNQQLMSVPYAFYAANGPAGPQGPKGDRGEQGPQGESATENYGSFNHYIGEHFGGGIVFDVYRDSLNIEHGLIVSEQTLSFEPFCNCPDNGSYGNLITDDINGASNTQSFIENNVFASGAIQTVTNYSSQGFTDWHLPSIGELDLFIKRIYELKRAGFMLIAGAGDNSENPLFWKSYHSSSFFSSYPTAHTFRWTYGSFDLYDIHQSSYVIAVRNF